MPTISWALQADFDRDGTYETDLTGYVEKPGSGLRISRGIGRDGQPMTSKLSVQLSNRGGEFTPENTASAFYGKLEPGVPIRVTATSGSAYTLVTCYAMRWKTSWRSGEVSMCQVDCDDLFALLRDGDLVNVTASTSRDTDAALVAIMDALGLVAGDRNFDDGVQDLPMHFAVGENPLEAMMQIAASEMGGMLYPDALGRIRFEARNSRLGVGAVDDTWGDGTSVIPMAAEYDLNPLELVTSVTARATVFRTGQADTPIFEFSQNMFTKPTATSMALTAGQVWERTFQANSAYVALTSLDAGYDYLANDAADGTGTDRTASLTATVTDLGGGRFRLRLVNGHSGTIYVTKFRLRGQPVEFYADRAEAQFSLSVPGLKAGRGLSFDVPFAGDTGQKLRDYAYQELRVGRYPWPVLRLTFMPNGAAAIASLLSVELGDLIYYADQDLALSASARVADWWYVEALSYDIPPDWAGQTFRVTVTLIPSYVFRNLDAIVFDTFARANTSGDLGTSFSGDVWADDSGFDISGGYAVPNSTGLQVPNLVVA